MQKLRQYFLEVVRELKKVSWPTGRQTFNLSALVISITILAAAYISGLDSLFKNMMAFVIGR